MAIDRKKFFDGFKPYFKEIVGKQITATQVSNVDFLLTSFENSAWFKSDVRRQAYALATIHIETYLPRINSRYAPVTEGGSRSYFNRYDIDTNPRKARELGNLTPGDGFMYRGRGYCQITGKKNYSKFGIADTPEKALEPETAFRILETGMKDGSFTGKKLTDYINGSQTDYKSARRVINGQDRAAEIAGYARNIESILRSSAAVSTNASTTTAVNSPQETEPTVSATPPNISLVPIAQPVIEVNQISAAPDEAKPDDKPDRMLSIGNRLSAVWTAAGASVLAIGAFLTSTPIGIAVSIIIAVAVVGGIYMLVNWRRNENKDNRDASEKLERDKWAADLKESREYRAFELQKLTLESATNPELNTVTIKAPPPVEIANSDTKEGNVQ